jgi:hypothetical protein
MSALSWLLQSRLSLELALVVEGWTRWLQWWLCWELALAVTLQGLWLWLGLGLKLAFGVVTLRLAERRIQSVVGHLACVELCILCWAGSYIRDFGLVLELLILYESDVPVGPHQILKIECGLDIIGRGSPGLHKWPGFCLQDDIDLRKLVQFPIYGLKLKVDCRDLPLHVPIVSPEFVVLSFNKVVDSSFSTLGRRGNLLHHPLDRLAFFAKFLHFPADIFDGRMLLSRIDVFPGLVVSFFFDYPLGIMCLV